MATHDVRLSRRSIEWLASTVGHRCGLLEEWSPDYPDDEVMREELRAAKELDAVLSPFASPSAAVIRLTDNQVEWVRAWFKRRRDDAAEDLEEAERVGDDKSYYPEEIDACDEVLRSLPAPSQEVSDG